MPGNKKFAREQKVFKGTKIFPSSQNEVHRDPMVALHDCFRLDAIVFRTLKCVVDYTPRISNKNYCPETFDASCMSHGTLESSVLCNA